MAVLISCGACGRQWPLSDESLGQPPRCPACTALLPPLPEEVDTAEETTEASAAPPHPRARSRLRVALGLGFFLTVLFGGTGFLVWSLTVPDIPEREWETFAPPNGRFTVRLPGFPLLAFTRLDGSVVRQYLLSRDHEEIDFAVSYYDVRPEQVGPTLLADVTAELRERKLQELAGQLIAERELMLDDYPGREIRIDPGTRHGTYLGRVYLAGRRVFLVEVLGRHVRPDKGATATFFDSFKIDVPSPNGPRRGFAQIHLRAADEAA